MAITLANGRKVIACDIIGARGYVVADNSYSDRPEYVTWHISFEHEEWHAYNGHYFGDMSDALEDYDNRRASLTPSLTDKE